LDGVRKIYDYQMVISSTFDLATLKGIRDVLEDSHRCVFWTLVFATPWLRTAGMPRSTDKQCAVVRGIATKRMVRIWFQVQASANKSMRE